MRQAGSLPSAEQAQRLSDYLLSEGIDNRVEQEADGWALWIIDDDHVEHGKAELAAFQRDPRAPKYAARADQAEVIRRQEIKEAERAAKLNVDLRKRWRRGTGRQVGTMALIGFSVLVAVLTSLGEKMDPAGRWLEIASYEMSNGMVRWRGLSEVFAGQVWRLVTPIFIHYGPIHLLFNMLWIYQLGNLVEARRGTGKFLLLVLAIAIPSNLAQYFWAGPSFGGMSGVDYGLLGYVWLHGRYDPGSGMGLAPTVMWFMLGWLLLGFTPWMPLANGAHVGGLVMGLVLAAVPIFLRRARVGR